jgi:ribosomal protein L36
MKVRASVKESSAKLRRRKEIVRNKQKNLDLNKDKDNYGKNSRVDPKNKESVMHLYLRIRKK